MQLLKKYWLGIFAAVLLSLAAFMIYEKLNPKELPPGLVQGVGHIDGDLITLNVKYPGRLTEIFVEEGDAVKKGQVVAKLNSDELKARLLRIGAEEEAKRDELSAKRTELEISKKSIPLLLEKASAALRAAESKGAQLRAEIAALGEVVAQDGREYNRTKDLYEKRLIQKELLEKAELKLDTDRRKLEALMHKREEVAAAIKVSEADLKRARAMQNRVKALEQLISALEEGVKAAGAAKAEVESMIEEMTLRSPIEGFVVEKIANPGEVLGGGMAVATLIDPDSLYLKIFVDTIENGKIKIGDRAVIFLDSYPDRPIEAKVVRIAQRAEFTPKEVNVRSDRIQRVFAVHIRPVQVDPHLKLGIPATGVIALKDRALPKSLDDLPKL